jgi:type II secretory pathway pseudopilin PulG
MDVKTKISNKNSHKKGVAIILSLIFVMMFSVLAVSLSAMASNNMQLAKNTKNASRALESAHSAIDIVRYHVANLTIAGGLDSTQKMTAIYSSLNTYLLANGIDNTNTSFDSLTQTINFANVIVDTAPAQTFDAKLTYLPTDDQLQLDITGKCLDITKNVRVIFDLTSVGSALFDFGVASKGPLVLTGQAEIADVNIAVAAGAYIEGNNLVGDAFAITNKATIAGDVSIANPSATFTAGTKASVAGATGSDIDDHIFIGVPYVDFPTPDPAHFLPYADGTVIDANTNLDNYAVLNNCIIAADTNPTFASHMTINGVLFIESPNKVSFAGQAVVNGIIVGDGSLDDPFASSSINFAGQVICNSIDTLTGPQFEPIQGETGTFIVAPGFSLDFSGQALNMAGAIAASGISFSGQAGGNVDGSLINYSDEPMTLTGQSSLLFNRSNRSSDPAGFRSDQIILFDPTSYSEPRS